MEVSTGLESAAEVADSRPVREFGLLLRAANRLNKRMDAAMRAEAGLSHTMFEVLLRLCREPAGRASQRELSDSLILTSGGTTRLVDRMEQAGLVRRLPSPVDRRITLVGPSDQGLAAFLAAAAAHRRVVEEQFLAPVALDERPHLLAALRSIVDALEG